MNTTEAIFEIHRMVGQIEGRMDSFEKVAERVSRLEAWQWWLKGAWAALLGAYGYIWKRHFQ